MKVVLKVAGMVDETELYLAVLKVANLVDIMAENSAATLAAKRAEYLAALKAEYLVAETVA